MNDALLVLTPTNPSWVIPDNRSLSELLEPVHLVGKQISYNSYLVGERFLDQVAFMGCAPDIRLEPGENNEAFCHIRLVTASHIECHHGTQTP